MLALTPQAPPDDRAFILIAYAGCAVTAGILVMVLRRFSSGRKRPIALGMSGLGALFALPGYLVIAGVVSNHTIPDLVSVPLFIGGMCLILTGMLILRVLLRSGER